MVILFGGSFDPIHIGHILIARDVKEYLNAQRVVFVPTHHAPLKEGHSASPEDRAKMVKLAIEEEQGFEMDEVEIKRGGISYTYETLSYMSEKIGKEIYLLLGSDSVLKLHRWRFPDKVLELSTLAVVDREGKSSEVRDYMKQNFPNTEEGRDYILIPTRRIDISSTEIRKRLREGKSIYAMVPDRVREYIEERGLYKNL